MKKILFLVTSIVLSTAITEHASAQLIPTWTATSSVTQATITGGPWTLQSGPVAGTTTQTLNYCVNGKQTNNTVANALFQPYYFPFVVGSGNNLQGYFDYRVKDTNEAIVAASSADGGQTWTFQQKALELNPGLCPKSAGSNNATDYPATTTANPYPGTSLLSTASGSPGASDDGQGHPYVMTIGGTSFLYTLDRSTNTGDNSVDNLGLVVHTLSQTSSSSPLGTITATSPDTVQNKGQRTVGLLNPDGIIGEVPNSKPREILYIQKQLNADNTGTTALPTAQQCTTAQSTYGYSPNHDITTVRRATTSDGINFTDKGPVIGLNDSTTVSLTGTRYIGPRGSLFRLANNRYGLFFSGGNCLDADSDAFHYIGYAESSDLINWLVINNINNPIASVTAVSPNGTTIPATNPVVGYAAWFAGRVYSPSLIFNSSTNNYTLFFAGYNTQKPANNYANYRTISRVQLNETVPTGP